MLTSWAAVCVREAMESPYLYSTLLRFWVASRKSRERSARRISYSDVNESSATPGKNFLMSTASRIFSVYFILVSKRSEMSTVGLLFGTRRFNGSETVCKT